MPSHRGPGAAPPRSARSRPARARRAAARTRRHRSCIRVAPPPARSPLGCTARRREAPAGGSRLRPRRGGVLVVRDLPSSRSSAPADEAAALVEHERPVEPAGGRDDDDVELAHVRRPPGELVEVEAPQAGPIPQRPVSAARTRNCRGSRGAGEQRAGRVGAAASARRRGLEASGEEKERIR